MLLLFTVLTLSIGGLSAQTSISGQVTGEDGEPVIGATVQAKDSNAGTITDIDGKYSLNVPTGTDMLIISYIGYQTQEIDIAGKTQVDVTMSEGITLGEIQVVGSRSYRRSATDSPVAVDVIDVADIAATTGRAELNQVLQYSAPSFNATKQSGSDGADHVDPASLRGLGPDQTLVLINGKRRHQ